MSYQVLARKYRPQTFAELVGQEHVVQTLSNAIATGRVAHAFLFVGPRGIGKTSTARILAKALNCDNGPKVDFPIDDPLCQEIAEGRSLDVIEIDGASNNNVDHVRELRENVRYAPVRCKFKIYIIDEVHMLSTAAFNALLKTLEEPPAHVKFIFATTEVHKLPATILSRCQRFDLHRISETAIAQHLEKICALEKIQAETRALQRLARLADGGMRDAESMLEQLISFCGTTIQDADVLQIYGLTSETELHTLAQAIVAGEEAQAIDSLQRLVALDKDLVRLTQDLLRYFRTCLMSLTAPQHAQNSILSLDTSWCQPQHRSVLLSLVDELLEAENRMRTSLARDVLLEVTVLRCCQHRQKVSLEEILRSLATTSSTPQPTSVEAPVATPAPPKPVTSPATPPPQPPVAPASKIQERLNRISETLPKETPPPESPPAEPQASVKKESTLPPADLSDDFKNDPLIRLALDKFEAKLLNVRSTQD